MRKVETANWLLVCWTALIFYITGQIWFAQLVVYPLFAKVGTAEYIAYHRFYSSRIPLPVIVPGFAGFLLPLALVFLRPDPVPLWMALANVGCGLVGLLVTVILEIPRHARLEQLGKQEPVIRELIRYNWPRTLAITGSAGLTMLMLAAAFGPA
jgi:hypothetical protein